MSNILSSEGFHLQIVGLMEELLREHCVAREHVSVALSFGSGVFVTVTPSNPEAAAIHLHFDAEGGFIDFSFGESLSTFELDGEDYLERLRTLAKAVMEGRCGEMRGFIAHTSWLEPAAENIRVRSSSLFHPRLWQSKRKFAPYSA